MKILVDTSVWVDFFNGHPSPQAEMLAGLLRSEEEIATCGVVMAEFFQGLRDPSSLQKLEPYFREMLYLAPRDPDTYLEAANLFRQLRRRGVTIRSTIDCVIAVLAGENDIYLLAKDKDFTHMFDSGICPAKPLPVF